MAKEQTNTESLAELQVKHEALADEVLTLRELVELLKEENAQLKKELGILQAKTSEVASSVNLAPPEPVAPERPVVVINDEQYQFKIGEVRLGHRNVVKATDLAADEQRLLEVFEKYPGLFRKI